MSILEEGTDLAFAVDHELNVAAEYLRRGMTGTAGFASWGASIAVRACASPPAWLTA